MQYPLHVAWGSHRWWLVSEIEYSNRESSRRKEAEAKAVRSSSGHSSHSILLLKTVKGPDQSQRKR